MGIELSISLLEEFQEELNEFVKGLADCSICGVCCKDEYLTLNTHDINIISKHLGIDKKTFMEKYTYYNSETRKNLMNMPYKFLKNNVFEIYNIRPKVCRDYPIVVMKKGYVIVNEIECCAISTHFYELLLDYCEKHHSEIYEHLRKDYEKTGYDSSGTKVQTSIYSVNLIALFIKSLKR